MIAESILSVSDKFGDKVDEDSGLTKGQEVANALMGAYFIWQIVFAIFWTVQLWMYQSAKAKAKGERFWPQLPKGIWFLSDNISMLEARHILDNYHVHNLEFGMTWTADYGRPTLLCTILVPASQYDYADAILHQHGVAILSEPGSKRGYTMRPPRDYSKQPAPRRGVRLGKTYS